MLNVECPTATNGSTKIQIKKKCIKSFSSSTCSALNFKPNQIEILKSI